jgi:tetratricopeptide (TPR) repeat protein
MDEGERELRAGNFAAAEKLLAAAAKADPRSAHVQYLLGVSIHEQGKLDRAIACYRKALNLDPGLAGVQGDLGAACMQKRRYAEALACYREAMRQDASDDLACAGAASALREMGELAAARQHFQRALWLKTRKRLRAPWLALLRLFRRSPA